MPQEALTANFRLIFKYTVALLQHKQQNYLECVASSDASGFDALPSNGSGNVGISGLANHIFSILAPFWDAANCSFDGYELEQRSGTAWAFVFAGGTTVVPTGGGHSVAMMLALSGKDAFNHNLPVYFYEMGVSLPSKVTSYAAENAANKALIDAYWNVGGSPSAQDPWSWRESKGKFAPSRWLATVIDSNEKLRRIRRIK